MDGLMSRWTDKKSDRPRGRNIDGQIYKQTDRYIER